MSFNQISPSENIGSNLIALNQWGEQIGRTQATIWRWRRDGWLKSINIAGRVYVSRQAIAEFERRAAAGEFSKEHVTPKRGAAR